MHNVDLVDISIIDYNEICMLLSRHWENYVIFSNRKIVIKYAFVEFCKKNKKPLVLG